jgi:hypothetical protein
VLDERSQLCELDALRLIGDRFPVGPAGHADTLTKVHQVLVCGMRAERPDQGRLS